jgi:hypothetical protein
MTPGPDPLPLAILDEVTFPSARGGRRPGQEVSCQVGRSLGPEDLAWLQAPAPLGSKGIPPQVLKHSHHQLARLLATGVPAVKAALITGYSQSYISLLQDSPAFEELLAHYGAEREALFVDVNERMKALGLDTLDRLQERLHDETEDWSRRELMELAELLLVKGKMAGSGAAAPKGPGALVEIKFVQAAERGQGGPSAPGITIDGEPPA